MAVLGLRVPMSINCVVYRYTEDFMADLAKVAMDLWDDLEMDSGTSLRWMSGLLNFGDENFGNDTPEGRLLFGDEACLIQS